jgi:hypothetical protein
MATYRDPAQASQSSPGTSDSSELDPAKPTRLPSSSQSGHPLASSEHGPPVSSEGLSANRLPSGLTLDSSTIVATSVTPQQLKAGNVATCSGHLTTYRDSIISNLGDGKTYYVTYKHVATTAKIAKDTPVQIISPPKQTSAGTYEFQVKASQDFNFGGVDKFGKPIQSGYQVYIEARAIYESHRAWKPGDADRMRE